jgi:hypothetical protein
MSNSTRHKERQRRRAKQKAKEGSGRTIAQEKEVQKKNGGGLGSKFTKLFRRNK